MSSIDRSITARLFSVVRSFIRSGTMIISPSFLLISHGHSAVPGAIRSSILPLPGAQQGSPPCSPVVAAISFSPSRRLSENAYLLRYPHPSSLRRTSMYASFLRISSPALRAAQSPTLRVGSPVLSRWGQRDGCFPSVSHKLVFRQSQDHSITDVPEMTVVFQGIAGALEGEVIPRDLRRPNQFDGLGFITGDQVS